MDRRTADEAHRLASPRVGGEPIEIADVAEHRHHRRWQAGRLGGDEEPDAGPVEDDVAGASEVTRQVGLAQADGGDGRVGGDR